MRKMVCSIRLASMAAMVVTGWGLASAANAAKDYACSVTLEDGGRALFLVQADSRELAREVALRNSVSIAPGKNVSIRQVHECIARLSERFTNLDDQRRYEELEL